MKKTCTKCEKRKDESDFCFRDKKKGTRNPRCRKCTRETMRDHYEANKNYYIKKAIKARDKFLVGVRDFLRKYFKEHPCVDCGESDVRVLQFDHVRGEKNENVSSMIHNYRSLKKIKAEIRKCDVRCANCHCKKTADERGYWSGNGAL